MEEWFIWLLGIIVIATAAVIISMRRTHKFELSEEELVFGLGKMSKFNPQTRDPDSWDLWFLAHINEFQKYDKTLDIIDHYGYISDTYFKNLKNVDSNLQLQKKLIEVGANHYHGGYKAKFSNLLCGFLRNHDFNPEIKEMVFSTPQLQEIRFIYKLYHKD